MSVTDLMLVFRTDAPIFGVYDTLFGGLFRWAPIVKVLKLSVIGLYSLSLLLCLREFWRGVFAESRSPRFLACLGFVAFVLLLNHPVDELFIGLRHSLHLAEAGNYSFNRFTSTEGVVDFLPYFTIGLLAKLGLPIVDMAFVQSLLGGILALLAMSRMLHLSGVTGARRSLIFLVLSLFAPLIYNSTIGFANSLFTAAILWATSCLFYDESRRAQKMGLCLLALIPVIRIEGGLICVLYFAAYVWRERERWKSLVLPATLMTLPLLALSIFRHWKFGSAIPLPIPYKSSFPNPYFFKLGLQNFGMDLYSAFTFQALFLIFSLLLILRRARVAQLAIHLTPIALLTVFTIPYYLSGGDWFPAYWGRYSLPLTTYTAMTALVLLAKSLPLLRKTDRLILAAQMIGLLIPAFWIRPANAQLLHQARAWWAGRGNPRIQSMSKIGNHLNRTSGEQEVIASSEIATIMFYAKREALDMLGVTNPRIVKEPLQPGHIYRRRNPSLIPELQPDYLWAGDHMTPEINPQTPMTEIVDKVNFFVTQSLTASEYYYGGQAAILGYGYRPVLVIYGNAFSALYFVAPKTLPSHLARLRDAGFREDPDTARKLALNAAPSSLH